MACLVHVPCSVDFAGVGVGVGCWCGHGWSRTALRTSCWPIPHWATQKHRAQYIECIVQSIGEHKRGEKKRRNEERERESRAVLSGNGDVVSGREWGNMAAGEVGLDAAGSASGRRPVGHRCVTGWALGTW